MKELWIPALTKPNEDHYTLVLKEAEPIDFTQVLKWVFVGSVVGGIASTIAGFINNAIFDSGSFPVSQGVFALVAGFFGFLIGTALILGVAKLFGGTGSYVEQGYLTSTWQVPLVLVNALLTIIPIVGPLIALGMSFYGLYLNALTVKVVHKFEWPKAVGVVLLPSVILFVCACGVILSLVAAGGAVGEVFEEVQRSLQP